MTVTWKESVKVAPPGIVPIGKATREFTFCKTPFSVTVPGVNIVPFGSGSVSCTFVAAVFPLFEIRIV
ncbi:Uncharacterised protein [Streptococcus pneumoniae]|nr:Uncharacterised protein [Streptococcus pneumoniae]CKF65946.1 Uncharacterised protein [Bacillus paranthracis]CKG40525.1 Uncharacterised protein [Streptococcus pneumoniae]CKG60931.1 Uncharacterised protein [Streptococcus pneumoniae]